MAYPYLIFHNIVDPQSRLFEKKNINDFYFLNINYKVRSEFIT